MMNEGCIETAAFAAPCTAAVFRAMVWAVAQLDVGPINVFTEFAGAGIATWIALAVGIGAALFAVWFGWSRLKDMACDADDGDGAEEEEDDQTDETVEVTEE
jgi:hypothetical protein